jgi:hypothetical protein
MPADTPLPARRRDLDYTLLEPLAPGQARFTFAGPFEGRVVVWDTTLCTLAHYHDRQPALAVPVRRSPFIEVGAATDRGRRLIVALDIPDIDAPAIGRTLIMIRQYKRLRRGRHEFGTARVFPPPHLA